MMRDTGTTTFAEIKDQPICKLQIQNLVFFKNTYEYQSVHSGRMESGMVVEVFPRFHKFLFVHLNEQNIIWPNDVSKE